MWVGCALLIIPGFIVALLGCLYPWFIVDQNMKGFRSLTASFNAVRSSFMNLLLLVFLLGLIYMASTVLGMVPCVGLLISMLLPLVIVPWFGLILTYVYLALIGESVNPDPGGQSPGDDVYAESPA